VVPALEFDDSVPKITGLGFADRFEIRTAAGDDSIFAVPPFWIRTKDPIEDDPLIRACTLTFMSDFGPVPVARPPGTSMNAEGSYAASLDHAVWFHRPFSPDQWHRYEVRPLNVGDARGLVVGSLYDGAGTLVASTSQEALWRF
jgi:acyl-CoA thioesterase II